MNAQLKASVSLLPTYTRETAMLKVSVVEDNFNAVSPGQAAGGCAEDCYRRNGGEFPTGSDSGFYSLLRP